MLSDKSRRIAAIIREMRADDEPPVTISGALRNAGFDQYDVIMLVIEMQAALRVAEGFIADELETRRASFLPDPTDGEGGYITDAEKALEAVRVA